MDWADWADRADRVDWPGWAVKVFDFLISARVSSLCAERSGLIALDSGSWALLLIMLKVLSAFCLRALSVFSKSG